MDKRSSNLFWVMTRDFGSGVAEYYHLKEVVLEPSILNDVCSLEN